MSYDYTGKYLTSLDGKTVEHIDVSEDDTYLRFRCAGGESVVWQVDGECCSHSYWADGLSLNALRGGTVVSVHSLELPDPPVENYEHIQVYGYAVVTDRGAATLAFRNSSNGYYGGDCHLGTDRPGIVWHEITANEWDQSTETKPVEPTPEEKFRAEAEAGLRECHKALVEVVPSLYPELNAPSALVDIVEGLQKTKTVDILTLGVYLTRRAEDALTAYAKTA